MGETCWEILYKGGKKAEESVIQKRVKLCHTLYDTDMYLKSSTNDFITSLKVF